ncbi:hypothetical protein ENSA5_23710 [Enhygromyxa salina]|uniref:Uncharacterized protein n=1 Tax=Enhygromyxa salina TaxID=215803 RepID=A0A2S9YB65_9BACT|nr:hypothetical protein [Enhygromyxa salina]PRQ02354.1 hypothetical protein ENSA5_23710 [Enhygromyxa salina]
MSHALRRALYIEDLEICAALYQRRREHLERPETRLSDLAELEDRIDAHVDALARGRELAAEVCVEAVDSGDAGRVHAATRALCRGSDTSVLTRFDARVREDPSVGPALESALALELTDAWARQLELSLESATLGPILARALGCRRITALGDALTRFVLERKTEVDPAFVWALGELRHRPALELLQVLLGRAKRPTLWSTIAVACLKLKDPRVARLLEKSDAVTRWSPLGQALAFEVPGSWLLAELEREPSTELVTAVALRGASSSFGPLIELLGERELGALVAGALFLITGAPLLEAQDTSTPASGSRLCRDPDLWREWFDEHAREWPSGQRRRFGALVDMPISIAAALCCAVPITLREALFDELALRFDEDPGLRPDGPARIMLEELKPRAARAPVFDARSPTKLSGPLSGRFKLRAAPRSRD